MNEFELISRLLPLLPGNEALVLGAGDDCAALDLGIPAKLVLFKTDAVVENVHFTPETPAKQVGRKALARCLSDIAAMSGTPSSALITLGLPSGFKPEFVEELYRGMRELALKWNVSIAGGETVLNPSGIFISVAMIGLAERERLSRRSGAQPGDAIFVTGELGGSITGKHLEFEPRIEEGLWLAEHFPIHAMIDVSDGLAGDLKRILEASGAGAELSGASVPISRAARLRAKESSLAKPPLLAALTDGEDFELLLVVPKNRAVALLDAWKGRFPRLKLTCIGRVESAPGLRLRDSHGVKVLHANGYTHFN